MPRRPRVDRVDLLHHVMNRAIARRTAFESERDIRMFLALVARAVRQGRIEVHAYSILSTHYHLLVRSLDGCLSETMRRIQNAYVRWFNRTRHRDGPLFRGRFRSIPVESDRYLHALIRYIDANPVHGRIVTDALAYPFGSAASQSGAGRRRPWICRTLVDRFLTTALERGMDRVSAYRDTFQPRMSPALERFVARRIAGGAHEPDVLDDLVASAGEHVRAWMVRKAKLADGTRPGLPMVTSEAVLLVVERRRRSMPKARVQVGPRTDRALWDVAVVALLRDMAGDTFKAIGRRAGLTYSETWCRYDEHRTAIESDPTYLAAVTDAARECLANDHPAGDSGVPRLVGGRGREPALRARANGAGPIARSAPGSRQVE